MPVIYTISHPLTNNIVYVGASKVLKKRQVSHINSKSGSPISMYIQELKLNYLLPKIEVIDTCDSDELMDCEYYWILQLKAWGFDLLNKYKTSPKKRIKYVSDINGYPPYNTIVKKRTSKIWEESDIKIGAQFICKNERNKRNVLLCTFKNYCRKMGVIRFLNSTIDGGNCILTVTDTKPVSISASVTKSGNRVYYIRKNKPKKVYPQKPKKFTWGFLNYEIGQSVSINPNRFESFKVSLRSYNKAHELSIFFHYSWDDLNKKVICTRSNEISNIKQTVRPSGFGRSLK